MSWSFIFVLLSLELQFRHMVISSKLSVRPLDFLCVQKLAVLDVVARRMGLVGQVFEACGPDLHFAAASVGLENRHGQPAGELVSGLTPAQAALACGRQGGSGIVKGDADGCPVGELRPLFGCRILNLGPAFRVVLGNRHAHLVPSAHLRSPLSSAVRPYGSGTGTGIFPASLWCACLFHSDTSARSGMSCSCSQATTWS